MASVPTALSVLTCRSSSPVGTIREAGLWNSRRLWLVSHSLEWNFAINSRNGNSGSSKNSLVQVEKNEPKPRRRSFGSLKETVHVLLPVVTSVRMRFCSKFAIMVYVASAIFIILARRMMHKRESHINHGSISDLVRRGQLKSNRRGIAKTGLYNDPFNNAFVKIDEENSTAQIFGKAYRLAPTTLTNEQRLTHQERRARAYSWKRPELFIKEGDPLPPDVDPDSVTWVPQNHPFASTSSDINEETVRNNVYQKKDGVPFRVRAEHQAMQKKKLEALQDEPKIKELAVNLKNLEEFDKPHKSTKKMQQIELNETKSQDDRIDKGFKSSNENS